MANYITVICRVKGETVLRLTDDFNCVKNNVFYSNDCKEDNGFDLSIVKQEEIEEEVIDTLNDNLESEDYIDGTQTFNYIWSGLKTQSKEDNSLIQVMDEYKKHLSIHKSFNGRQLFVCRYENCKYQSLWENTTINHIRSNHLLFFPFDCNKCDQKFAIPSKLNNHIKKYHMKREFPFEESSQTSSADKDHNYSQNFFKKKTFFNKKSNNFRKRVKHFGRRKKNIGNHKNNDSNSSNEFINETKEETSDETPTYVGIKSVEKYMKSTVRNGKIVWRSCTFANCSYGTKYATSILYHIRNNHLNDKPYVCTICGNRYPIRTNLNNHKRVHKSRN